MNITEIIIYVVVTVILPILPAYILYKTLPAGKSIVRGPFKGLNIQLTGAFAGYFLIILTVFGFIELRVRERCQIWQVTGYVVLEDDLSPIETKAILVSEQPPSGTVNEDGSFKVNILVHHGATGELEWPILVFDHPSERYDVVPIDPSTKKYPFGVPPYRKTHHNLRKLVIIDDRVVLKKKPVK
ncbi:MAG TPA: hypothetical protein PKZ42_06185 [Syntrophales bacterium]|nr:hypothetical protein [Syntrophales bacterium]